MKTWMVGAFFGISALTALAAPPETANVFPDFATEYPNTRPHLITGEGFEPGQTEIWIWAPAKGDAAVTNALATLSDPAPLLPDEPPKEARRVSPLDVERQVIVASLEGVVAWVKTTAGTSKPCLFNVPKPCWLGPERVEPGCCFLSLELRSQDKAFKRLSLGFIVDADHYRPALTRPPDFRAFWDAKLAAMRAVPFEAKLTEVSEKSTEGAAHYALELKLGNGQGYRTHLQAPRRPGRYLGRWYPLDKATDTNSVRIGLTFAGQATFSTRKSRDESNMLDCYLLALRLADYLRSRPDVDRLLLWGASRSGPINYCVAALDPARIAGVDIHVPTSAGIGWVDKPYRGWGQPPDPKMAAYFDPVNFAPDMVVPFVVSGTIDDGLSPAPGIVAMFTLAQKCPWKRCAIGTGGHQYLPIHKDQFVKELEFKTQLAPP